MKRDLFAELAEGIAALAGPRQRERSLGVRIGPGVFRRRGALPRPPDRVQVLDFDGNGIKPLREAVLELFRDAARRK